MRYSIVDKQMSDEVYKARFLKSLMVTNHHEDYFVDWKKVKEHTRGYDSKLHMLQNLVGSNDFDSAFLTLLQRSPEIAKVIPILLATRGNKLNVLKKDEMTVENFNFKKDAYDVKEAKKVLRFIKLVGLDTVFKDISNLRDYVYGVEVGMDTNTRKNRSGKALENILEPFLKDLEKQLGFTLYIQKSFKTVNDLPNNDLKYKKNDFLLRKKDYVIDIECNYYNSTGSKPAEIINSYENRQRRLKQNGYDFILITDGKAWKKMRNGLGRGIQELDFIFNLALAKKYLPEVLKKLFKQNQ